MSKDLLTLISILISSILLGSEAITFVTCALVPLRSRSRFFALIPIIVKIHEARALATVSVGEKASPFPLLSIGASVINESFEAR